jgi:bifunctional enzyme CysN/CysC
MDLVDYDETVFERIKAEFRDFAARLKIHDLSFVPISALHGDNIVHRSQNMPWYAGSSLLHLLEEVHIASDRNLVDVRFPVQYVIRPQDDSWHDYRGYAGQVASGVMKPGDDVMVLPSGFTSTIAAIETMDGQVDEAFPPMSVTVRLSDNIDVSRGDMLCRPNNQPDAVQDVEAVICWMHEQPMDPNGFYRIKHTTRDARAKVSEVLYRLDVNTLHRDTDAATLSLNDVGRIRLRTTVPLFIDRYERNRTTGSFVLIHEGTNATVAAGMIQ